VHRVTLRTLVMSFTFTWNHDPEVQIETFRNDPTFIHVFLALFDFKAINQKINFIAILKLAMADRFVLDTEFPQDGKQIALRKFQEHVELNFI
jgi:hypothetical protein